MRGVQTVAGLVVALAVLGFGAVLWARPTPLPDAEACESAAGRAYVDALATDPEALRKAALYVLRDEARAKGDQGAVNPSLMLKAKLELRVAVHRRASAFAYCQRAWGK